MYFVQLYNTDSLWYAACRHTARPYIRSRYDLYNVYFGYSLRHLVLALYKYTVAMRLIIYIHCPEDNIVVPQRQLFRHYNRLVDCLSSNNNSRRFWKNDPRCFGYILSTEMRRQFCRAYFRNLHNDTLYVFNKINSIASKINAIVISRFIRCTDTITC